jgi:hypothetical protein
MRIVVTLVTSLLPQLLVFQVVLQGGNGCKGKKLYVCAHERDPPLSTHLYNLNKKPVGLHSPTEPKMLKSKLRSFGN